MSFVAVAIGVGVAGAALSYGASQNAANAQTQAADAANQSQERMFNQQRADQAPWRAAGQDALSQLQGEMPSLTRQFTMQDFHQDPGYQFQLDQGQQAMQRSAAAKGMLNSTGTLQGLNNYAQGMASNEYGNAYNRFTQSQNQRFNMLSGVAGTGQVANGQLGQANTAAANNISNNLTSAGNAKSAGAIATGNTFSNLAGQGANTWMNYNMMNRMFPGGGGNAGAAVAGMNFNGSSQLGQGMGALGGGNYAPAPSYGVGGAPLTFGE